MAAKFMDLENGGVAVEPEEPRPASDDYIPGPGCVFGVLFGAVALVGVVLTLVCYGPWPALGMAAVSTVMDYIVVLGAREGFKNEAAMMAQIVCAQLLAPLLPRPTRHQQPNTTAGQAQRSSKRTRKLNPYVTDTDWEN